MIDKNINSVSHYAAVDLGSNSFHMVVANHQDNRVQIVDKIKEPVRLAGGLNEKRMMDHETMDRAMACLERFGQRITDIPGFNIRAVGTNTLRQARNVNEFLTRAKKALGHSVEIISGREEARLIYMGVAHSVYNETEKRLVVDIGGGSTELIIGKGFDTKLTESLYMGCVNMSHRFFADGEISIKKMRKAIMVANQELEPIGAIYKKTGWETSIGASGTIKSICDVVINKGWSENAITRESLHKLKKEITNFSHLDQINLAGLSDLRTPVFPGGVAILCALFDTLNIDSMIISDGALREGLLYDLIGRLQNKDIREQTVNDLIHRYSIDSEHAVKTEQTAADIFYQLKDDWNLEESENLKRLKWAARLHEIGLTIAHSQYHKHGAYLLNHSELPGFSRQDQLIISTLVRYHRRKLKTEDTQLLLTDNTENLIKIIIILRLAILLNRGRSSSPLPDFKLSADNKNLDIKFPEGWLSEHPLTETDLETEFNHLSAIDINLNYK